MKGYRKQGSPMYVFTTRERLQEIKRRNRFEKYELSLNFFYLVGQQRYDFKQIADDSIIGF